MKTPLVSMFKNTVKLNETALQNVLHLASPIQPFKYLPFSISISPHPRLPAIPIPFMPHITIVRGQVNSNHANKILPKMQVFYLFICLYTLIKNSDVLQVLRTSYTFLLHISYT